MSSELPRETLAVTGRVTLRPDGGVDLDGDNIMDLLRPFLEMEQADGRLVQLTVKCIDG